MSTSPSTLRLEVVAVHSSLWDTNTVDQFRTGMLSAVERVEKTLRADNQSVGLQLQCVTAEQACVLRGSDVTCAVAVIDVSQNDEGLALFAGRLQGAGVPCVLVCHTDAEEWASRAGLSSPVLLKYRSIDDLFHAGSVLQQELLRAVPQARIHEELTYQFWFPRETSTVWVVCPQIHDPGEFADRSSPDYTYLDNLGDTDTLLEVMVFLSQYYPHATIERFSASDLPVGHTSGNLVVVGGPGSPGEISNEICMEMMSAMRSHVFYSADCERMTVARVDGETVELRAQYRTDEQDSRREERLGLQQDQGCFARSRNPHNEHSIVVLINGLNRTGFLGDLIAWEDGVYGTSKSVFSGGA